LFFQILIPTNGDQPDAKRIDKSMREDYQPQVELTENENPA